MPKHKPERKLKQAINRANKLMNGSVSKVETMKQPRLFTYAPREDITAYELARALEMIFTAAVQGNVEAAYERLPDEAKRHFEVQKP